MKTRKKKEQNQRVNGMSENKYLRKAILFLSGVENGSMKRPPLSMPKRSSMRLCETGTLFEQK